MEKELKHFLEEEFRKLVSREEVSRLRNEMGDLKTELKGIEERVLHQYHITAEALRDDIKQVAEGVMNLNEKFDRETSGFRKDFTFSQDEIKAMIKFSYSELDRRLTKLESDFENLKHRVARIEGRTPPQ